ncbi:MAG: hypothetical protein IJS65_08365, partial [Clostridia bacterium]|nr:hypothetical protein [Clostridia bacterium]
SVLYLLEVLRQIKNTRKRVFYLVQLSVPLTRNVKYPTDVKRASRVKCAFRHDAEHLTSLCGKAAILHGEQKRAASLARKGKLHFSPQKTFRK